MPSALPLKCLVIRRLHSFAPGGQLITSSFVPLLTIQPWLMEKSEACPMCKRPAFRPATSSLSRITSDISSSSSNDGGGGTGGESQNTATAAINAVTLDEVFIFLMNNLSFFAMVLVAVLTSMTVLGAIAILRPT